MLVTPGEWKHISMYMYLQSPGVTSKGGRASDNFAGNSCINLLQCLRISLFYIYEHFKATPFHTLTRVLPLCIFCLFLHLISYEECLPESALLMWAMCSQWFKVQPRQRTKEIRMKYRSGILCLSKWTGGHLSVLGYSRWVLFVRW